MDARLEEALWMARSITGKVIHDHEAATHPAVLAMLNAIPDPIPPGKTFAIQPEPGVLLDITEDIYELQEMVSADIADDGRDTSRGGTKHRKEKCREIGKLIHRMAGLRGMQDVYEIIRQATGPSGSILDYWWDGVGDWIR